MAFIPQSATYKSFSVINLREASSAGINIAGSVPDLSLASESTLQGNIVLGTGAVVRGGITLIDGSDKHTGGINVDCYTGNLMVTPTQAGSGSGAYLEHTGVELDGLKFPAWSGSTLPQTVLSGYIDEQPVYYWTGALFSTPLAAVMRCCRVGNLVTLTSNYATHATTAVASVATLSPELKPEYRPTLGTVYGFAHLGGTAADPRGLVQIPTTGIVVMSIAPSLTGTFPLLETVYIRFIISYVKVILP